MNLIKQLWNKLFHKREPMQEKEIDYKQAESDKYEALMAYNTAGQKKQRRPNTGTNYTPPKKKRK
jgi:hypothetical protein